MKCDKRKRTLTAMFVRLKGRNYGFYCALSLGWDGKNPEVSHLP